MGKCKNPTCTFVYTGKKPFKCKLCWALLGGSEDISPVVTAPAKPRVTSTRIVKLSTELFSVHANQAYRCCVLISGSDQDGDLCSLAKCQERKIVEEQSGKVFSCDHIELTRQHLKNACDGNVEKFTVKELKEVLTTSLLGKEINGGVANLLTNFADHDIVAYKVAAKTYLVRAKVGPCCKIGWTHVYLKQKEQCGLGASCKRVKNRTGKRQFSYQRCIHEAISSLLWPPKIICSNCSKPLVQGTGIVCRYCPTVHYCDKQCQTAHWTSHKSTCRVASVYMVNTAKHMIETVEFPLLDDILPKIEMTDAYETMGDKNGQWPREYYPAETHCTICGSELTALSLKSRGTTGRKSLLLSSVHILEVDVWTRKCRKCLIVFFPTTLPLGLICVGGVTLVSIQVMSKMMPLVDKGLPLSCVAEFLLGDVNIKSREFLDNNTIIVLKYHFNNSREKTYLEKLLPPCFYAYCCLTVLKEKDECCGICGSVPGVLFGDGNENLATKIDVSQLESDDTDGCFSKESVHDFMTEIRKHFVSYLVYPSSFMRTTFGGAININNVPPLVLSQAAGNFVFNTENKKDSSLWTVRSAVVEGSQKALCDLISSQLLDINKLPTSHSELKSLCQRLEMKEVTNLSKAAMTDAVLKLHNSILTGISACHATNSTKKTSGGWYSISCPHGVVYGSKILMFSESVRDCADLYLSLKTQPSVMISDTPCTLSSHLLLREPEKTQVWFSGRKGCFESPKKDETPSVVSVPALAKLNDKPQMGMDDRIHPRTLSLDKYILGDRFHAQVKPHRDSRCAYHSVDLCPQLASLGTSYQENLNSTKNNLRLRSTNTQSVETHWLYNVLMDRFNNRKLIQQQKKKYGDKINAEFHIFEV